jgi:hypothetical protein
MGVLLVAIGTGFGILFALLLAEIYYRVTDVAVSMTPGCEWVADPETGFANPRNKNCHAVTPEFECTYTYNSDGNAGHEFNPDPNLYTVMALGDSHTVGVGVDSAQAWPNIMEKTFGPACGHPLQVVNTGVGGFSLGQEFMTMKKFLPKMKPRHVVLGLSLATDAYDIRTPEQGGFVYGGQFDRPYPDVMDGKLVFRNSANEKKPTPQEGSYETSFQTRMRNFLIDHSALFRATYRGAVGQTAVQVLRRFGANPWPNAESVLAKNLNPTDQHSWLIIEKLLGEFQAYTEREHVGFTLVIIPYLPQIYDEVWERAFGSQPDKYDRFAGNKRLQHFCSEYHIDCLDLTEPFIDDSRKRKNWLHYKRDAHPTPEGHRFIGGLVAEHLKAGLQCSGNQAKF